MLLIGARILEYRKAANMSQEEFALKIGVSRQAVSKWELDKAYPDLDKLMDICDTFDISIDELIHGRADNMADGNGNNEKNQTARIDNFAPLGKMRGAHGTVRLKICTLLVGMLCMFCCTVFVLIIIHNVWDKDNEYTQNARVERVYTQYTKADISFSDDDSRRVLKTVWLDTDGIRDGDYIQCYTDSEQQKIYLDYYAVTLIIPGMLMLLFLCLFVFLLLETRRMGRENRLSVLVEEMQDE